MGKPTARGTRIPFPSFGRSWCGRGNTTSTAIAALLHEYPLQVGRRGSHFSGPSAGATLRG